VFAADKNYYIDMEDVSDWEEKIDTYGIGKKGRRTEQEYEREHSESFKSAQKFRAGCEGTISVLKRVFGLERCVYRSFKSFASAIGRLVFCHNLVLLATR
jgi:IS5 family transposase